MQEFRHTPPFLHSMFYLLQSGHPFCSTSRCLSDMSVKFAFLCTYQINILAQSQSQSWICECTFFHVRSRALPYIKCSEGNGTKRCRWVPRVSVCKNVHSLGCVRFNRANFCFGASPHFSLFFSLYSVPTKWEGCGADRQSQLECIGKQSHPKDVSDGEREGVRCCFSNSCCMSGNHSPPPHCLWLFCSPQQTFC